MTNDECQMESRRFTGHSPSVIRHSLAVRAMALAIRGYQLALSPVLSLLCGATGGCRYTPTCSVYAVDALREHGAAAGSVLAVKRICRCHPWGGCGHDPVPRKNPEAGIQTPKFI